MPQEIAAHKMIKSPKKVFEAIEIPTFDPVTMSTMPVKASPIPIALYRVNFSSVNR